MCENGLAIISLFVCSPMPRNVHAVQLHERINGCKHELSQCLLKEDRGVIFCTAALNRELLQICIPENGMHVGRRRLFDPGIIAVVLIAGFPRLGFYLGFRMVLFQTGQALVAAHAPGVGPEPHHHNSTHPFRVLDSNIKT